MKKKMNNKGFSLVELIVVIAIMAILAVTLAPRLTQYIDKSRVSADTATVSAIFDAARLADAEFPLPSTYSQSLGSVTAAAALFQTTGDRWAINPTWDDTTNTDFYDSFAAILQSFSLKQTASTGSATITLTNTAGVLAITLDYNGVADTDTDAADIVITE